MKALYTVLYRSTLYTVDPGGGGGGGGMRMCESGESGEDAHRLA